MADHLVLSIGLDSHNNYGGYTLSSHTVYNRSVVITPNHKEKQQHISMKTLFCEKILSIKRKRLGKFLGQKGYRKSTNFDI